MSTAVATLLFNELVKLRGPMFTSEIEEEGLPRETGDSVRA